MKRNIVVFGTISGSIVAGFMAISMALFSKSADADDMTGGMIIGFASMAIAFAFIFVGIKNYRDKQNGGVITFGQGFLMGLMISLIASTMYVITWAIEFHCFMPDFMDKYAAMQLKQIQDSGMSGEALANAVKSIENDSYNYKNNPLVFTAYTYMEILPVGILMTLIAALVLKRKTPATA